MTLALLEVMDKEPTVLGFWVSAAVWGVLGFFLARRRWWWAIPVLALLVIGFLGTWSEWTDPHVGPAIAAEGGRTYPYYLIASSLLVVVLTAAGIRRSRLNSREHR